MGLIDEIDKLDLSEDVKAQLRAEHQKETAGSAEEMATLRAKSKQDDVKTDVESLKNLGFSEAPGLLKFVRRVFLSDDDEPAAVLLTDADMQLSGDDVTDAVKREEITVSGAIKKFIELMPRNAEGKLALSDQALLEGNDDKPDDDEENDDKKSKKHGENLAGVTGVSVERTRKRYKGGRG